MESIILIKTVGGEFYIGYNDPDKDTQDKTILRNCKNLTMQMTMRGAGVAAIPVIPFADKSPDVIEFPKNSILCQIGESDIKQEMLNGFRNEGSGIVTPKKPSLIIP